MPRNMAPKLYGQNSKPLYTPEQRIRRDTSKWTIVQGILAPLQFIVFLISTMLVFRTLLTGEGYEVATLSIVIKTLILYIIMATGAIWEKVVFGKYLFVESFFWEDVFSMLVLALHTAYLLALYGELLTNTQLLALALAAYFTYVINAAQFILKLRAARAQKPVNVSNKSSTSVKRTADLASGNSQAMRPDGVYS